MNTAAATNDALDPGVQALIDNPVWLRENGLFIAQLAARGVSGAVALPVALSWYIEDKDLADLDALLRAAAIQYAKEQINEGGAS